MEDFEISIKSRPEGSAVVVKGNRKMILAQFAMLAAAISQNTGLPLGLLATAVNEADAFYRAVVQKSIKIDADAIEQQLRRKD